MARYIDADKTKRELLENAVRIYDPKNMSTEDAMYIIDEAPTADVVEVKHGEWIYNTDDFTPKMRCSVCGYNKPIAAGENIEQEPSDFCNKCGADMRGDTDGINR